MGDLHVVFGASGGAGGAVVRALAERGERVRAVRRGRRGDLPPEVETVVADAMDANAARAACAGATVVYHCVNTPYSDWPATLPVIMDNLIAGAGAAAATLVYCDNLYMYGPVDGPMTEETPRAATGAKGRLRVMLERTLLEAHTAGRVRAAIGRGSDFFGPGATNTVAAQLVFAPVVAGRRGRWVGSLDRPHSLNYIDDFARGLITLGGEPAAAGQVWHIPAVAAPTGREFIHAVCRAAGRRPKAGVFPRWLIRIVAVFDRTMRELLEVLYQFERAFTMDAGKYIRTFGEPGLTPLDRAVARTLDWHRQVAGSG